MKKVVFIILVLAILFGFRGNWEWPATGPVSQGYNDHNHGIDIAVSEGTPVLSSKSGIIERIENHEVYGLMVMVKHSDGYETLYAHNSKIIAREGEEVSAGTKIALSGNTGRSTGPHIHFEIRHNGKTLDPIQLLKE